VLERRSGVAQLRLVCAIAALVSVLGLVACSGEGTDSKESNGSQKAKTSFDTSRPVTLRIYDGETRGDAPGLAIDTAIKLFERKYPKVTVKRVAPPQALNNYYTAIKLAASGSNPADIFEGDPGYGGALGILQKAKLLRSLDDYNDAYEWSERFGGKDVLDEFRFTPGAAQWGEGDLVAIPQIAEILGVYYNKKILRELKLEIPTTLSEFAVSLKKAKAADYTPIALGNIEPYAGGHVYEILQDLFTGPSETNALVFGREGASIDTPEAERAATMVQDWAQSGYFSDGFNGLSFNDAAAGFEQGKALYSITGSWQAPVYDDKLGADVGFFLVPGEDASTDPTTINVYGWGFSIHRDSQNADVAAAFLNLLSSDEAMSAAADVGAIPARRPPGLEPRGTGSFTDVLSSWFELRDDHLPTVQYLGRNDQSVFLGYTEEIQRLLLGDVAPSEAVAKIQATWTEAQTKRTSR
jgi:raffinose/stachyose/melibiose transport system substrate-binding protein